MPKKIEDQSAQKFTIFLLIIATALAGGAFALAWAPSSQLSASDPRVNGYTEPRDIGGLVENTQDSTVTIFCNIPRKQETLGTGWAVKLKTDVSQMYPTTLITNYHVIKKCLNKDSSVTISALYEKEVPAVIVKWDKEHDLAVLATGLKVPALPLSKNSPFPGYWVAAIGSADGYEGSVAFGSVLNVTDLEVFVTNNVSHGNSGGALVDNEGAVVGVITWGMEGEQYNGAKSLDAFCFKILKCDTEYYWDRS